MAIPKIRLSYKIRYRVQGFDQEFETPYTYTEEEVDSHTFDIAGFGGVYGVYALPVHGDNDQEVVG